MANELVALSASFIFFLVVAGIWSAMWKGVALWNAARNSQIVWFIVLLVVNTLGILEIIYLLFFRNTKQILVRKGRKR
jgi:heme A synthase